MRKLNPMAGMDAYANEVRDGFATLLRVLVGIGDLLAAPSADNARRNWRDLRGQLEDEDRL